MALSPEDKNTNLVVLGILNLGALLLIIWSVYMIKTFSILWGIGIGAGLQSVATNTPVAASLQQTTTNLGGLHGGILESYVILLIALVVMAASFLMLIRRHEKNNSATRRYGMLHLGFVIVYAALLWFVLADYYIDFQTVYLYAAYAGIAMGVVSDLYFEYSLRVPFGTPDTRAKMKHSIAIDPSRPFANVVTLQEQLFSNMQGHLRIIDKHFNSAALTNLHRLMDGSTGKLTKITMLTAKSMLDSKFQENLSDFRSELTAMGVGLEVKLMDDKDAVEQHERILMDDKIAYKIPPFNIITKRSEHISKINYGEASKRFLQIWGRAIKMENYAVQRARTEATREPPQPQSQKPPDPPQIEGESA